MDLETLGGYYSEGFAINGRGQVVGLSTVSTEAAALCHAFLWTPENGMEDLGTLTGDISQAMSINERGEVVGIYGTNATRTYFAFIWTEKDGMLDLGSLVVNLPQDVTLTYAMDINGRGEIVGLASDNRAFLLTPVVDMSFLQLLLED